MKKVYFLAFAVLPAVAMAGKMEREFKTNELMPAVSSATAVVKSSCGCAMTIKMDDSIATKVEMGLAKHVVESVKEGAPKYCTDAASKGAVCKMKTLMIKKANNTGFAISSGVGTATTDGTSYPSWDMMTDKIDP